MYVSLHFSHLVRRAFADRQNDGAVRSDIFFRFGLRVGFRCFLYLFCFSLLYIHIYIYSLLRVWPRYFATQKKKNTIWVLFLFCFFVGPFMFLFFCLPPFSRVVVGTSEIFFFFFGLPARIDNACLTAIKNLDVVKLWISGPLHKNAS